MHFPRYRAMFAGVAVAGVAMATGLVAHWPGGGEGPVGQVAAQSDRIVLSPEAVSAARAAASERESTVVADGVITREEYTAVVDGTVTCLEQHGFRVAHSNAIVHGLFGEYGELGPSADGVGVDSHGVIEYSATGGTGSVEENGAAVGACKQESALVERLWQQHAAPAEADEQGLRSAIGECLRGLGYNVPKEPSTADLSGIVRGALGSPENLRAVRDLGRCDMEQALRAGSR